MSKQKWQKDRQKARLGGGTRHEARDCHPKEYSWSDVCNTRSSVVGRPRASEAALLQTRPPLLCQRKSQATKKRNAMIHGLRENLDQQNAQNWKHVQWACLPPDSPPDSTQMASNHKHRQTRLGLGSRVSSCVTYHTGDVMHSAQLLRMRLHPTGTFRAATRSPTPSHGDARSRSSSPSGPTASSTSTH